MRIEIDHHTVYAYDEPVRYGVQEFRLTPRSYVGQQVQSWSIEAPGFERAASLVDAWGNTVHLVNQTRERIDLPIRVRGTVDTIDRGGIIGRLPHEPQPRIFLRTTPLTRPDAAIEDMAASLGQVPDKVELCHALMAAIAAHMTFDTDVTHAGTTAAQAFAQKRGVCQDFSHVFIAACRQLALPSRYVTGYLYMPAGQATSEAHHAWAETEIPGLGWVGFDPANGICPDARYVRLACGPDATLAAPLRGLRRGAGEERLSVSVSVQAAAQSSQ